MVHRYLIGPVIRRAAGVQCVAREGGMRHSPKSRYRNMDRKKAAEVRRVYFAREANQRQIAERFGIKQGTVSRIVSGQVWA